MHGGAADVSMMFHETSQNEREARQAAEKAAIGKIAAKLIGPQETIMLDASSTALELARQLPDGMRLKVLTYSHGVVEKLAMRNDIELVLLGGSYESRGKRFMGMLTEMNIRTFRIDRFFFSGDGFDADLGIGEPNPEESRLKAMVISHARWCCALIDHTKFGKTPDHFFVKPEQLDLVVTDQPNEEFSVKLKRSGVKLLPQEPMGL